MNKNKIKVWRWSYSECYQI